MPEILLTNTFFIGTLIFIIGLCIGSFLNVVIYRLPEGISIVRGRSNCMSCKKILSPLELIPVLSYIFLRGKCRNCGTKFSFRYMMVEIITATVFLSFFLKYGISAELFFFCLIMSVLIVVFYIDLDHMIIPDGLVIFGIISGFLLFFYHGMFGFNYFENMQWWGILIGGILPAAIIFAIAIIGSIIYKGADVMGGGDIKIFVPIGLFLGWKMALVSMFMSFFVGGIVGLFLILFKIKDRKENIPFGPYIVIAAYITMLFGHEILKWYSSR